MNPNYKDFYKDVVKTSDLDLIVEMMRSQGSFVAKRIPKSEYALFAATIEAIILEARKSIDVQHLNKSMISFAEDNLKEPSFFFRLFSNPVPTKRLAYNTAQDVIRSVEVRFIDGGSKFFPEFYNEKFKIAR